MMFRRVPGKASKSNNESHLGCYLSDLTLTLTVFFKSVERISAQSYPVKAGSHVYVCRYEYEHEYDHNAERPE